MLQVVQCPNCPAKWASEKIQYNPTEVRLFVHLCVKCAYIPAIIQLFQITEPFELVGVGLMKLTVTEGGNQYIYIKVNYFTK